MVSTVQSTEYPNKNRNLSTDSSKHVVVLVIMEVMVDYVVVVMGAVIKVVLKAKVVLVVLIEITAMVDGVKMCASRFQDNHYK